MDNFAKSIVIGIVLFIFSLGFGAMLMFLWNMVVPDLFGLAELTLLQGIVLFWLSQMLTGGIFGIVAGILKT